MDALVAATNLCKSFGAARVVDGVSLSVSPGEAYGVVGPDGAGKTTTMRLLVGALTADEGEVSIAGRSLRTAAEAARANVGYLAQRFSLYGDLTVLENLHFFGEVRGMGGATLRARARELLQFVGLSGFEQRRAASLSGGMKQKLGLACALIHRPGVLLLDEPTGGVDPVTRQDFWQLIIRLLAEGVAVVVSTPYMDEAVRCNRLGFMYGGHLLIEGTPGQLIARLDGHVLELVAEPRVKARNLCLQDPNIEDAPTFGDRLHLRVAESAQVLAHLPAVLEAAGVTVLSLRPIRASLEDVFISLLVHAEDPNA